ncbi:hypothetical protein [Pseudomonas putida]|uniref:hypothetical protein n=1 Tax=Pseudomonas putida TaxID=303 RepID=UPI00265A1CEC|nr:hypothetical protein [Pseudomonas putida]MCZ9636846.1 hypothetical protein [Pseudomonas putida]
MRKGIIYGVGINDERTTNGCPFYNRWKGVIRRCFAPGKNEAARYAGCSVDPEWLRFSAFKRWMQDKPWEGNHLDKDILRPQEKRYSPDTCVFVPIWINTLLNDCAASSGALPTGVYLFRKRYIARTHDGHGKRLFVGSFDCPHEAHRAWATAKAGVIRQAVDQYRTTDRFDERVCAALLDRADQLAAT